MQCEIFKELREVNTAGLRGLCASNYLLSFSFRRDVLFGPPAGVGVFVYPYLKDNFVIPHDE